MSRYSIMLALSVSAVIAAASAEAATTITEWSFTSTASPPDNSPAPSIGSGSASTIGFVGSVASDDVISSSGAAHPSFTEDTWRIRNAAGGWSNSGAEYSEGVQLDASTVGYSNIGFSFDWFSTNQAIRDLQFQYNTNVNNAAGWTNFGGTSATGTYIATPNDFYNGASGSPTISVDLSSIAGANNDPNFGVRLVAAYDSTGNLGNEYAAATLANGLTTQYNGTSGNWRFDNLAFSGTATPVPLPPSAVLILSGLGGLTLLSRRRRA